MLLSPGPDGLLRDRASAQEENQTCFASAPYGLPESGPKYSALFYRPDGIAIEVRCALFEFSEVFDRAKAALRSVNLLVKHSAQAGCIEAKPALLGPDIGREVELCGRMSVNMAVQTGYTKTRVARLAVVGGIELLLRKRCQQELQAIELHGCQNILE